MFDHLSLRTELFISIVVSGLGFNFDFIVHIVMGTNTKVNIDHLAWLCNREWWRWSSKNTNLLIFVSSRWPSNRFNVFIRNHSFFLFNSITHELVQGQGIISDTTIRNKTIQGVCKLHRNVSGKKQTSGRNYSSMDKLKITVISFIYFKRAFCWLVAEKRNK